MFSSLFEIVRHKGHDIHVTVAEEHESPREVDETVGSLVIAPSRGNSWSDTDHWAKEYEKELLRVIARQDQLEGAIAEFSRWAKKEAGATVVLPVGRYSHGRDIYYTFTGANQHGSYDRWDSGFVGFMFDTPDRLKLWSMPALRKPADIKASMLHELEAYNHWANNEQYCYVVAKPGAQVDSDDEDGDVWSDMMGCCYWEAAEAIADAKGEIDFDIRFDGQQRVLALTKRRPRTARTGGHRQPPVRR